MAVAEFIQPAERPKYPSVRNSRPSEPAVHPNTAVRPNAAKKRIKQDMRSHGQKEEKKDGINNKYSSTYVRNSRPSETAIRPKQPSIRNSHPSETSVRPNTAVLLNAAERYKN